MELHTASYMLALELKREEIWLLEAHLEPWRFTLEL
jgi:hypothetical protein